MEKEELKKLYIESKKSENNEFFLRVFERELKDVLSSFRFEMDCVGKRVNFGTKRRKILINVTTVRLRRGHEFYMTQRINALIDFIFSPKPDENTLFDIIYNRI